MTSPVRHASVESEKEMGGRRGGRLGRDRSRYSIARSPSQTPSPKTNHTELAARSECPAGPRLPVIYRSPPNPLSPTTRSPSRRSPPLANTAQSDASRPSPPDRPRLVAPPYPHPLYSPREPTPHYAHYTHEYPPPRGHHSALSSIHPHSAEYYPPPVSTDWLYPPPAPHSHMREYGGPSPYPSHVYMHPKDAAYRAQYLRPRLRVHPYAPPAIPMEEGVRYQSSAALPYGHGHARGKARPRRESRERYSPASAINARSANVFKSPRKRADDAQLSVLSEVFQRTSYPTTEERDELAAQLGMTSRSVQIWFQNRRRAVKVDQQSAAQRERAEAEARGVGISGPPHGGSPALPPYVEERTAWRGRHCPREMGSDRDARVKRERVSPDGRT